MFSSRHKNTHNIDSLVSMLGQYTRRGDWLNFRCPFHHGGKRNFGVNVKSKVYSCFGCGAAGRVYDLQDRLKEDVGYTGYGLLDSPPIPDLNPKRLSEATLPPDEMLSCDTGGGLTPDQFSRLYKQIPCQPCNIVQTKALKYLAGRGVDTGLWEVGLIDNSEFRCRVVFPFRKDGKVVFCQGRAVYDIPLKTLNVVEKNGWAGKGAVLFNYDNLRREPVVLCEGIFDAISTESKTGIISTCLLGTSISNKQIQMLKGKRVSEVTVFLDNDANDTAISLGIFLYEHKFTVNVVQWPDSVIKEDPASVPADKITMLINSAIRITTSNYVSLRLL